MKELPTYSEILKTIKSLILKDEPVNLAYNSKVMTEDQFKNVKNLLRESFYKPSLVYRNEKQIQITAAKDPDILTYVNITKKIEVNSKNKIFVVSGVVAGAAIDKRLLASIETFQKQHKAELYLLPVRAHAQAFSKQKQLFDKLIPKLFHDGTLVKSIQFNKNLVAIDTMTNPQKLDHLQRVHHFEHGKTGSSIIIAAPSLDFKVLPRGNHSTHPHIAMCSGVITKCNYQDNEIGLIATQNHKMGVTIVEIVDNKHFFLRQCEMISDGSFVCMGKRYYPNGEVLVETVQDILLGDPHIGQHDNVLWKASLDQIRYFKPVTVRAGDFDGSDEVSPWAKKDTIQSYHTSQIECFKSLNSQKQNIQKFLKELLSVSAKTLFEFVPSNHTSDWLYRAIMSADFRSFSPNDRIEAMKVYIQLCENKEKTIEEIFYGKMDRVVFRGRNEDVVFKGIQMNVHGDKGANGTKGSAQQYRRIYGKINIGHVHSPYRHGDVMAAGTLAKLADFDPVRSQLGSNVITYDCGTRESVFTIDGRWKFIL